MKKVILIAAVFAFLLPGARPANAALLSSAYLLEICKSDKNGKELVSGGHAACQSYIAGVVDYHNLLRSLGTSPSVDMCVPGEVPLKQLQDVVAVYLEKNPQHDSFIAAPAVALALFEKYPCPQVKKKR